MAAPSGGAAADRGLTHRVTPTAEMLDRQVAGRADVAPPETAGQEPLGAPAPESAYRGQSLDDLIVRQPAQSVEIERSRGDLPSQSDVFRLHRGELHPPQVRHPRAGQHRSPETHRASVRP